MTDAEQIEAFLAQRGATRVPAGEGTMTGRAMYRAVRAITGRDPINERRLAAVDHCGREYWVNGLGERIT